MPPISAIEDFNSGASSVHGKQAPPPHMGQELFTRLSHAKAEKQRVAVAEASSQQNEAETALDAQAPAEYAVGMPPESALAGLSDESRECIERLAAYSPAKEQEYEKSATVADISYGLARLAAVLIALYQKPGETTLRVILTTRAAHLRRNPGQTVKQQHQS